VTARTADVPAWVIDALGADVSDVRRIPWGFTNQTWAGTAIDGRRYAATRMASPDRAAQVIRLGPEIARRITAVGLGATVPIASRSLPERGVVVSTWVDGAAGMARLGTPQGAAEVGSALGVAWRALTRIDPRGLGLADDWARPRDLAMAARRWLEAVRRESSPSVAERLDARIGRLPGLLDSRPTSFVHGDLVPANILLRDGAQPVLLDFEASRVADPLLDAGWFSWIVRHHHPAIHATAWAAFAAAAGLAAPTATDSALLDTLPVVRILEILADAELPAPARAIWLGQLRAIVVDR
jgi:aminoglycoside phosphotransferase (APT) family kinase protein